MSTSPPTSIWRGRSPRRGSSRVAPQAGAPFRSQLAAAQWQSTIEPLRRQLGGVSGRSIQDVTRSSSLPGLPAGDYEVLQFRTSFANKPDAIETVALARARSGWQVIGYFIK